MRPAGDDAAVLGRGGGLFIDMIRHGIPPAGEFHDLVFGELVGADLIPVPDDELIVRFSVFKPGGHCLA